MSTTQNKPVSIFNRFFLAFFIPGHLVSRFTLGICLGIALVGLMNIALSYAVENIAGPNLQVHYGTTRIALFITALSYITFLQVISRSVKRKRVQVENSMNAESGNAHKTLSRAA